MSFVDETNKCNALNDWFLSYQGTSIAQAFAAELKQIREQLHGMYLLQLGNCGENLWLPSLPFRYKWIVGPKDISSKIALSSSLTLLPIDRNSIDCVVAPLSMEIFSGDKNPIEEIDRVLKPMGHVIFLGINPFSFWGAAAYFHQLNYFGKDDLTLTSALSVKHMMQARGYIQSILTNFYYLPPLKNESLIKKLAFFNEMGKMIWPFTAGFYCQIFQKYQYLTSNSLMRTADKLIGIAPKPALEAMR